MNNDIRVGDRVQILIDDSALTSGVVKTAFVEESEEGRIPRGFIVTASVNGSIVETYCEPNEVYKI